MQIKKVKRSKHEKALVGRHFRLTRETPPACCTPARRTPAIAAGDRMWTNERNINKQISEHINEQTNQPTNKHGCNKIRNIF